MIPLRRFVAATLLFWLLAASWAWATPLGGSPDEPAHAIRAAAVATGQIITPAWEENPAYGAVVVPEAVATLASRTCFAFDPDVTPSCWTGPSPSERLVLTGTSAALNSPVYYALVGWPSQFASGDAEVYAMRLVSAFLCAALFGLAVAALPRSTGRSPWPLVGTVAAITPMTAFLAGSVNPNGVEALSALALLMTGHAVLRAVDAGRAPAAWEVGGAVVALVLLVNARSIGFLWAAIIITALLVHAGARTLAGALRSVTVRRGAVLAALPIGLSLLWLTALPDYDQSGTPTIGVSAPGAAARALLGSVELLTESVGLFGWMDTPAPAASVLGHGSVVAALVTLTIAAARRRSIVLPGMFFGAAIATPVVVQFVIADELGYIWQGRYTLAMVICAIAALGLACAPADRTLTPKRRSALVMLLLAVLAVSHIASGLVALRRYVTGTAAPWSDLLVSPTWQPPLGWPLALLALVLATLSAFVFAVRWCRAPTSAPTLSSAAAPPPAPNSTADLSDDRPNPRGAHDVDREPDIVGEA